MHNMEKIIGELHALLIEYEKGLPKKAATLQVMAIQGGRIQKANKKSLNAKGTNSGELHWTVVKTILKYLRNTKNMFLVYGGHSEAELRVDCYCDDGFEINKDDTKSQTRDIFVLNGGAVDWKSSKQILPSMSLYRTCIQSYYES
ncbi:hypothetical protein Tco_0677542 [Tanacetum coccineum]|uniref:Zinc finger, CCHC-type n=1 Tax=Tanacetum coccineum TaxID=301880 RepID=A0ABQ4XDC9_9ASTR